MPKPESPKSEDKDTAPKPGGTSREWYSQRVKAGRIKEIKGEPGTGFAYVGTGASGLPGGVAGRRRLHLLLQTRRGGRARRRGSRPVSPGRSSRARTRSTESFPFKWAAPS
jgi:hypothetical protein